MDTSNAQCPKITNINCPTSIGNPFYLKNAINNA